MPPKFILRVTPLSELSNQHLLLFLNPCLCCCEVLAAPLHCMGCVLDTAVILRFLPKSVLGQIHIPHNKAV